MVFGLHQVPIGLHFVSDSGGLGSQIRGFEQAGDNL